MSFGVSAPNSKFHQTQLKILVQAWQQSSLLVVIIEGAIETLVSGVPARTEGSSGKSNANVGSQ